MSRLHNWHPPPLFVRSSRWKCSAGISLWCSSPGVKVHYDHTCPFWDCMPIIWISSGRCLSLRINRSFALHEMLCFWDYIRFFYSEEDLDLLVSTLYVCWAVIFVTDSSQFAVAGEMDMLLNYEVCVCMWVADKVKGRKHREKERWRSREEEKEGGAKESVLTKRRQMPDARCQSVAGVCIQMILEYNRGGYIYVYGQMF